MDFGYTPEQNQLRSTIRAFAEAEIKPHVMEWDESQHFPLDVFRALGRLGVTVRTDSAVTDIDAHAVAIRSGEREESIPSRTVLWAAGVQASPLGHRLADATGAETDRVSHRSHPSRWALPQM